MNFEANVLENNTVNKKNKFTFDFKSNNISKESSFKKTLFEVKNNSNKEHKVLDNKYKKSKHTNNSSKRPHKKIETKKKDVKISSDDKNKLEDKTKDFDENEKIKKNELTKNEIEEIQDKIENEEIENLSDLKNLLQDLGIEVSDELLQKLQMSFPKLDNLIAFLSGADLSDNINLEKMSDELNEFINILKKLEDNLGDESLNSNLKNEKTKVDTTKLKQKIHKLLKELEGKVVDSKKVCSKEEAINIKEVLDEFKNEYQNKNIQKNVSKDNESNLNHVSSEVNNISEEKSSDNNLLNEKDYSQVEIDKEEKVSKESQVLKVSNDKSETPKLSQNKENLSSDIISTNKNISEMNTQFKTELDFKILSKVKQMTKVYSQIKNNLVTKFDSENSEVKMLLHPKSLGEVEVKMTVDKGHVLAEFKVESMIVKQAIESNLQDLKQSLTDKGYSLEGLDVSVNDENEDRKENQNFYENIFDFEDENEEEVNGLIRDEKLIEMMKRRLVSYIG